MVHPTCAHARHPDSPADGELSSDELPVDLAVLRKRIAVHKRAMDEAYEASTCLGDLLAGAQRLDDRGYVVGMAELRTLVGMISAEFQRRMTAAMDLAMQMQALEGEHHLRDTASRA